MTENEIITSLNQVFREVFDDETITVSRTTTSADVDGWDSLSYLLLIQAVEDRFHFQFEMKDIVSMPNVGAMIDIIQEHV
jgi:acyl carrier protein